MAKNKDEASAVSARTDEQNQNPTSGSPIEFSIKFRPYHIPKKRFILFSISLFLFVMLWYIVQETMGLGDTLHKMTMHLYATLFGAGAVDESDVYYFNRIINLVIKVMAIVGLTELLFGRQLRRQKRERREQRSPHAVNRPG